MTGKDAHGAFVARQAKKNDIPSCERGLCFAGCHQDEYVNFVLTATGILDNNTPSTMSLILPAYLSQPGLLAFADTICKP